MKPANFAGRINQRRIGAYGRLQTNLKNYQRFVKEPYEPKHGHTQGEYNLLVEEYKRLIVYTHKQINVLEVRIVTEEVARATRKKSK